MSAHPQPNKMCLVTYSLDKNKEPLMYESLLPYMYEYNIDGLQERCFLILLLHREVKTIDRGCHWQ